MNIRRMLPLGLFLVSVACAGKACPPSDDGGPSDEGDGPMCMVDSDCVPAQCCHASSCVPASEAPNCEGVVCTLECQPGTMDCGQGQCECVGETCTAVFTDPL